MARPSRRRQGGGSAQTHIAQTPSRSQEEVHLHSTVHNPSLGVTPQQRPGKAHSCLQSVSVTRCQGIYTAQMTAQVRSGLLSNSSVVFNLLTVLHQSRMKECSALSFESIDLWWFTGRLYLKQQTRGEGFGSNLHIGVQTQPDEWRGSIKCHLPCQPGRYSIHMDGHASSPGHTCSACRQNGKWSFGIQVQWWMSFVRHLLWHHVYTVAYIA